MGLEESNHSKAVVDFLLANHDWKNPLCSNPLDKVEVKFQCLKEESNRTTKPLARTIGGGSIFRRNSIFKPWLVFDARVVNLGSASIPATSLI